MIIIATKIEMSRRSCLPVAVAMVVMPLSVHSAYTTIYLKRTALSDNLLSKQML